MDMVFHLCFIFLSVTPCGVYSIFPGLTEEYCMEIFNPRCDAGQVIVMERAQYGRMAIGKCVKMNSGLGCSADELLHLDQACSGRPSCEVFIPSPEMTARLDCLKEMSPYLEARFRCQKVINPSNEQCKGPKVIKAGKEMEYISLTGSQGRNCGSRDAPYVLEAKSGQTIMLTLLDFSWKEVHSPGCQLKYGRLLDMASDGVMDICGGRKRERMLYTTTGHQVQIVLQSGVETHHALIGFQAIGCPDYEPPSHSWTESQNKTLAVGCSHSEETWKVQCVEGHWLGLVGTCPPPPLTTTVQSPTIGSLNKSRMLPKMTDNHVVAFAMGCVTIVVCCSVVMAGYYCTKRYEVKTKKHKMTNLGTSTLRRDPIHGNRTLLGFTSKQNSQGILNMRDDTLDLPPYAAPLKKDQRPPPVPNRTSSYRGDMTESMMSDYLAPQGGDDNSVQYYILENPTESGGKEEMYQSIHLFSSLERAPENTQ